MARPLFLGGRERVLSQRSSPRRPQPGHDAGPRHPRQAARAARQAPRSAGLHPRGGRARGGRGGEGRRVAREQFPRVVRGRGDRRGGRGDGRRRPDAPRHPLRLLLGARRGGARGVVARGGGGAAGGGGGGKGGRRRAPTRDRRRRPGECPGERRRRADRPAAARAPEGRPEPRSSHRRRAVVLGLLVVGVVACACVFPAQGARDARGDARRWETTLAAWSVANDLPRVASLEGFYAGAATARGASRRTCRPPGRERLRPRRARKTDGRTDNVR